MKLYERGKIALYMSLAVASVLVVGCVVSDKDVHYTGIEDETLKQIKPGQTTRDWLVSTLGEPTEQSQTQEGTEILRYRCTKKQDHKFVLFPIVVSKEEKETEYTVAFEIKDGIVQRYRKEN